MEKNPVTFEAFSPFNAESALLDCKLITRLLH